MAKSDPARDEALADAYIEGAKRYNQNPDGDPRGPYDGRTALGKAWYRGWRDAYLEAEAALSRGKEASGGS